ncbi:RNA-binding S4 domain-containing protein [Mycoplasmopsis pullorum]|uniref:RNA-binding protein n=1 Tax=Mycoplasmopsis pullorum TaxID=48003 RepID=A0A1L4FRV3_9BACT|nr:RNA-binding S4 domain-containing protein [Mycoplasmopsis pullorum]APJ38355.1 RNA-binding protein [Mycoplasmopsis pullorum]TNK82557.1 RNA-binding protein [Mycoplasmopsis pullorum]TNK82958.1 RNA-binding protein [Mycoplasmopsis pullorum]TNK83146.1 RNA-binding protein [Mycoplasmopsis pullorum]TNK84449.1 RNA-binding protein [Mycoplasmopsis pullorum]
MTVKIKGESIKVSQFLKKIDETQSGGQSKKFLLSNKVLINGKKAEGRSSKIKPGDIVWVNDTLIRVVSEDVE